MDRDLSDQNEKKKRRKRTDQQGRNYTCECGKSYLSYPALYTHIKTKHSSKLDEFAPHRFMKDQQQQQSPSPKQEQNKVQVKQQEKPQQSVQVVVSNQPVYGINASSSDSNIIFTLKQILNLYFPNPNSKLMGKNRVVFNDQQKKFLKESKEYWNGKRRQEQKYNCEGIQQTTIQLAFGRFIFQFDKDIGAPLRRYMYMFFLKLRKYINDMKETDYCKANPASELPNMFNEIIKKFIDDEDDHLSNPSLIVKTLYLYARWLYAVKYTNFSLKYNF